MTTTDGKEMLVRRAWRYIAKAAALSIVVVLSARSPEPLLATLAQTVVLVGNVWIMGANFSTLARLRALPELSPLW